MHIARQTPQELVVVAGTRWVSAICAAAALFVLCFAIARHQPKGLLVAAFFLLFALIMDLRKTFTFDAVRRIVRWRGRKVFKAESGEIPFDDITDIGTEASSASSGSGNNQVPVYRLTIVTPGATIPMAYAYNGQPDRYATLRRQILDFVKPGSAIRSIDPEGSPPDRQ
jgi:hypothetical protein